jgi:hypothetical protein
MCLLPCHQCSKTNASFLSHVQSGFLGGHDRLCGNLEYTTKHGKKPVSVWDKVCPNDVKSALCLVVNLFLEQPKVKDEDSNIHDSFMKLIKTSAVNEGLHVNSFGKVSHLFR